MGARGGRRVGGLARWNESATGSISGSSILAALLLWLAAFFLLPFLIVAKISLSQTTLAQPPYLPLFDPAAGWAGVKEFLGALSHDNYATRLRRQARRESCARARRKLAEYLGEHPEFSADVGQVMFGDAMTMTADAPVSERAAGHHRAASG